MIFEVIFEVKFLEKVLFLEDEVVVVDTVVAAFVVVEEEERKQTKLQFQMGYCHCHEYYY